MFRLYPARHQTTLLADTLELCRWVYNETLATRKNAFYVGQFVKDQTNRRIKRTALRRSFLEVVWKPEPIAGEKPQSYQQLKTQGTEVT
jgi:putative transposase